MKILIKTSACSAGRNRPKEETEKMLDEQELNVGLNDQPVGGRLDASQESFVRWFVVRGPCCRRGFDIVGRRSASQARPAFDDFGRSYRPDGQWSISPLHTRRTWCTTIWSPAWVLATTRLPLYAPAAPRWMRPFKEPLQAYRTEQLKTAYRLTDNIICYSRSNLYKMFACHNQYLCMQCKRLLSFRL